MRNNDTLFLEKAYESIYINEMARSASVRLRRPFIGVGRDPVTGELLAKKGSFPNPKSNIYKQLQREGNNIKLLELLQEAFDNLRSLNGKGMDYTYEKIQDADGNYVDGTKLEKNKSRYTAIDYAVIITNILLIIII